MNELAPVAQRNGNLTRRGMVRNPLERLLDRDLTRLLAQNWFEFTNERRFYVRRCHRPYSFISGSALFAARADVVGVLSAPTHRIGGRKGRAATATVEQSGQQCVYFAVRFRLARARLVLPADSLPQLGADKRFVLAGIQYALMKNLTFVDHVPYQSFQGGVLELSSPVMLARFADPVLGLESANVYFSYRPR
jgi:hypothetical protein